MNSIDFMIEDYTLRELQIESSKVLATHKATNHFIKQFRSNHDSQQFYKNVIKWYVEQYGMLPSDGGPAECINQVK